MNEIQTHLGGKETNEELVLLAVHPMTSREKHD